MRNVKLKLETSSLFNSCEITLETENLVSKQLFEIGNIICIKYPQPEFFKIELYVSNLKQLFRNFCFFN